MTSEELNRIERSAEVDGQVWLKYVAELIAAVRERDQLLQEFCQHTEANLNAESCTTCKRLIARYEALKGGNAKVD